MLLTLPAGPMAHGLVGKATGGGVDFRTRRGVPKSQGRSVPFECYYSAVMTDHPTGPDLEIVFASLIIGFICFFFCFAVFVYAGLWMDYIPLLKRQSPKQTALVYGMLIASFGISCLATSRVYSFFTKYARSRHISNRGDRW